MRFKRSESMGSLLKQKTMRIKMAAISSAFIFLFSCTTSPFSIEKPYSDVENYHFGTGNTDIEFVKDTEEYVVFIGEASTDPSNTFEVLENDHYIDSDTLLFLDVLRTGYVANNMVLDKVEVHYKHVHIIDFADYTPPTSLGVYLDRSVTTRECIVEDSIEIVLRDKQRGMMEVNTSYLHLQGWNVTKIGMKGFAHRFEADFATSRENNSGPEINFAELETDSCFLDLSCYSWGAHPYTRIDVNVNDYLEIHLGGLVNSCSTCTCEVYYKGHPTIDNDDSWDPRIVVIDNN